MISCNHVTTLHDYPISLDCFDGVEIKGGVCHFLMDKDYSGTCQFFHHDGKQETMMDRYLKEEHCEVLIRFETLISIYRKVLSIEGKNFVPFSSIVSGRSPFGLNTNHHGHSEHMENDIPYLESVGYTFIDESRIKRNSDVINKYKVYISKAYGAGEGWPHQIINKPIVGIPGDCCSGTYLVVGPFNTQIEAINVVGYMKTKLFRILVSINKISQDAYAKVYNDVPLQDFSRPWTDADLYAKYHLTAEEIDFIESMIKPME